MRDSPSRIPIPSLALALAIRFAGSTGTASVATRGPLGTATLAISGRSWSSVCSQNTGTTGVPVRSVRARASTTADAALYSVYSGPRNRPTCCPVTTAASP